MNRFLIYTSEYKDTGLTVTNRISQYLTQKGAEVFCLVRKEDWKNASDACWIQEVTDRMETIRPDLVLVLGGDGTVLQAVRETAGSPVPIIGVNLGNLGYLTAVELNGLEDALDHLLADEVEFESRMMLEGSVWKADEKTYEGWALNDIVLTRCGSLQILSFRVYVNGKFLHEYHADGVILTTPTGSTGYNLSAGGPLVEPVSDIIVLTPICAHTLNQRSIVLRPEDTIEVLIPEGHNKEVQNVEVNFDGSHKIALQTGDRVCIGKSKRTAHLAMIGQVNFLEVLNRKMRE